MRRQNSQFIGLLNDRWKCPTPAHSSSGPKPAKANMHFIGLDSQFTKLAWALKKWRLNIYTLIIYLDHLTVVVLRFGIYSLQNSYDCAVQVLVAETWLQLKNVEKKGPNLNMKNKTTHGRLYEQRPYSSRQIFSAIASNMDSIFFSISHTYCCMVWTNHDGLLQIGFVGFLAKMSQHETTSHGHIWTSFHPRRSTTGS